MSFDGKLYVFPIESAFKYLHQLNRNESSNGKLYDPNHFPKNDLSTGGAPLATVGSFTKRSEVKRRATVAILCFFYGKLNGYNHWI